MSDGVTPGDAAGLSMEAGRIASSSGVSRVSSPRIASNQNRPNLSASMRAKRFISEFVAQIAVIFICTRPAPDFLHGPGRENTLTRTHAPSPLVGEGILPSPYLREEGVGG